MLILAEGTIHRPVVSDDRAAAEAWLGPMVDAGFLQQGYVDTAGSRLWMVIASTSIDAARQWLNDLPVVRDGSVSFATVHVTALRFH